MNDKILFALLIVIAVLIVVCIIFLLKKSKNNYDEEINEILDDLKKSKPRKDKEKLEEIEEVEEEKNELINEKIEIPIGEKKKPTVVKDEKMDLDDVLNKMQKTLDSQEQIVQNFEEEQEEKSIISYKELVESLNKEKKELEEIKEDVKEGSETKEKIKEFLKTTEEDKKFKNTDFISPIFGKMDPNIEYPTVKMHDKEEKKEETSEMFDFKHAKTNNKNIEFLESLKEFRNNL